MYIGNDLLIKHFIAVSDDAIRIIDKHFNIVQANQRYASMNHLKVNDIVGGKCYEFLCSGNCDSSSCSLLQLNQTKKGIESTFTHRTSDKKKHYLLHIQPILSEINDSMIGIIESQSI